MPRRATTAVCAMIALAVCAAMATGQSTPPAFQPFFRMGGSPDYRASNRLDGDEKPAPSASSLLAVTGTAPNPSYSSVSIGRTGEALSFPPVYVVGDYDGPPGSYSRIANESSVIDLSNPVKYSFISLGVDINGDDKIERSELLGSVFGFSSDSANLSSVYPTTQVVGKRDFTSLELMKQHSLSGEVGSNTSNTGWRLEGYHNDWSAAFGDEARGHSGLNPQQIESIGWRPLRELAEASLFSVYSTIGLRSVLLNEKFSFNAEGFGSSGTSVAQKNDHYLVGPQFGLGAVAETSMLRFEAVALGLAGYGRVERRQHSTIRNNPMFIWPENSITAESNYRSDDEQVALHGETRLTCSCQLTQQLRFDATWRWYVTGPVFDAADSIVWTLPNYGMRSTKGDAAYGNDWFLGLTYNW